MSPPPRSIAVLAAVQAIRLTLGVAVAIVAARWLGPEGWGLLGFARGAAQAWWFLIGLGALDLVTRAVAHDPRTGLVAGLHRALPAAAVLGTLGTALTAWAIDGRADVVGLAALAAVVAAVTARGVVDESALLATGHARDQLAPTLVARTLQAVGVAAALWAGLGPAGVLLAALVSEGLLSAALGARRRSRMAEPAEATPWRDTLAQARPYALHVGLGALYLVGDVLVLQALRGEAEVGVYQGAAVFTVQLPIVAQIVFRALVPRMATQSPAEVADTLAFGARVTLAFAVPVAVGGALVATPLLVTLLGDAYAASAGPLIVLLATMPLRFLDHGLGRTLMALGHQPARTRAVAIAAGLNLALNALFVPAYGAVGAAATMLVTEGVLYVVLRRALARVGVQATFAAPLWRPALAALPMAGVVIAASGLHVGVQVALGAGVYAAVGYLVGAWGVGDVRRLGRE